MHKPRPHNNNNNNKSSSKIVNCSALFRSGAIQLKQTHRMKILSARFECKASGEREREAEGEREREKKKALW